MLTRGRAANHLPPRSSATATRTVIRPHCSPHPTETLQQILARDESLRHQPAARTQQTAARCSTPSSATPTGSMSRPSSSSDPRSFRCSTAKPTRSSQLTSEPSWPTLRAHLLALAAETGEHHSSTSRQPPPRQPPDRRRHGRCTRLAPPGPHSLTKDRCRGFPAYRQRFMIIRLGRVPGEAVAARYRPRRSGSNCRQPWRTAIWAPPGSHPTAALLGEVAVWRAAVGVDPKTADQPEQDSYKRRAPFGNRTSTETLPCAAPPGRDVGIAELVDPLKITSAKIDIACLQHALFVGASRPGRQAPVSAQEISVINTCCPARKWAHESSTCVQDRLRLQRGLRASDNSHRNRALVIHRLPQHRLGVGHLLDRRTWAHEHRWTPTVRDRTA